MNITRTQNGSALTLALEGRLDTTTSPELEQELKRSITGVTHLEFDLKNLEYISSSGLRILLSAQKAMHKQGDMIVRNPNELVKEVFDVTGFSDVLTIR